MITAIKNGEGGLVGWDSGCKIGFEYYKTKKQAEKRAREAKELWKKKEAMGYDSGYRVVGEIRFLPSVIALKDVTPNGSCWEVIVP